VERRHTHYEAQPHRPDTPGGAAADCFFVAASSSSMDSTVAEPAFGALVAQHRAS
jgi:hypothetical protein